MLLPPVARATIWTVALVWKSVACLANARHCGRIHCYFTGPFFLIIALLVMLHASQIVSLGPHGWLILGAIIVAGTTAIWIGTERLFGKYRSS